MFATWFELGLRHIGDFNAFDHMLFVVLLTVVYMFRDVRKVVLLVTAFTVGHTLTLLAATFDLFSLPSRYVEFAIPVTIFLSGFYNMLPKLGSASGSSAFKYVVTAIFGLVHGLGFSGYLVSLLGREGDLLIPLLAFNLGIEAGQLLIVLAVLLLNALLVNVLKVKHREWILAVSGIGMGMAFMLILDNAIW